MYGYSDADCSGGVLKFNAGSNAAAAWAAETASRGQRDAETGNNL